MTLAHTLVTATGASPSRTMLFLHGILGTKANWRTLARRFVDARPDWAAMLVDLREHGESLGLPGPDTVAQCAKDLEALEARAPAPLRGVLGHSFGGKVALTWLAEREGPVDEAWIVDSMPGALPGGPATTDTSLILDLLGKVPELHPDGFESRESFTDYVKAHGLPGGIADWLAMNLKQDGRGRRYFALDVGRIAHLLESYCATDAWDAIEAPRPDTELHLVIGTRSSAYGPVERARADAAAAQATRVHVHYVDAGHWVHVDAPKALLDLLTSP